jgi:hypothetical protein
MPLVPWCLDLLSIMHLLAVETTGDYGSSKVPCSMADSPIKKISLASQTAAKHPVHVRCSVFMQR